MEDSAGSDDPTARPERRRPENAQLRARIDMIGRNRDVALSEVYHRFANCLQLLSGLIQMRLKQTRHAESRAYLSWLQNLIVALGLLEKHLAALGGGGFATYLIEQARLWRPLCAAQNVEIAVDAEEIEVPARIAVPVALALHELVTNCLEHAFPASHGGEIRITLKRTEDGSVELTVADDGVGLPRADRTAQSLGLRLVESLAAQVEGVLTYETGAGTVARLRFPLG